jgi:hypothetical protein
MRNEDDLRAALQTLERHAPDPDIVLRPLRHPLDGEPRGRRGVAGRHRRRAWLRVIVPLAAAASVIALVAGALVAAGVIATGRTRANHGNGTAAPVYPPPTVDGLPAYFLAVPFPSRPPVPPALRSLQRRRAEDVHQIVDIVVTATGRVAATASLPGGVAEVAATGTGIFYAAVTSADTTAFYEIRPPARGTAATVTRLPIPALPSIPIGVNNEEQSAVAYLAVSPDGRRLAISTYASHGQSTDIQGLIVASTTTGSEHVWTTPEPDINGSMGTMAWLADGRTLALNWLGFESPTPASLRLLDTAAAGSDLLAGRVVAPLNRSEFSDFTISPDGKILIGIADHPKSPAVVQGRPVPLGSAIEFSVRTGRAHVLYQPPALSSTMTGMCNDPLWMSDSGQQVLLACTRPLPGQSGAVAMQVVLLDRGRVTRQLPWLAAAANGRVAFGG